MLLCLSLLYVAFMAPVRSQVITMKIGILYDHLSYQYIVPIYQSVVNFPELMSLSDVVSTEGVKFDVELSSFTYGALLEQNLTALVVIAKKLDCDEISVIKKKIPIFVVQGSFISCDTYETKNHIFYLYPPDDFLLSAMLMATQQYEWKRAIVLEEKNEEFSFTFTNMQQARDSGLSTTAFEAIAKKKELKETLASAKREGIRAFIVMAKFTNVEMILSIAEELELTDKNFHWFVPNAFLVPSYLKSFLRNDIKISSLYSPILTPLAYKLMQKNTNEENFMNEVVSSLTLISVHQTWSACKNAGQEECINEENGTRELICKPNPADILSVTTTAAETTTISSSLETTFVEETVFSSNSTTTSSPATTTSAETAMMHHMNKRSILSDAEEPTTSRKSFRKHKINCAPMRKGGQHQKIIVEVDLKGKVNEKIRSKRWTENDTVFLTRPNPDCLLQEWNDNIVNAGVYVANRTSIPFVISENSTFTSDFISDSGNLDTISITTNIDSCYFTNEHEWDYIEDSCSDKLVKNTKLSTANSLFIVEYHDENVLQGRNLDRTSFVVGGYMSETRSFINSKYRVSRAYDVALPNRNLSVGAIYHSPWLTWKINEETGEEEFDGYLFQILEKLSESMNFTYNLRTEYNLIHTDVQEEESVESHMLKAFNNNSVDFFLHAKSVRGNRLGKSDTVLLSSPFQQPLMFLITKRVEKTQSVSIWQFMMPFREESWILFWSTFILISLMMAYINMKNPKEYEAISHEFGPNSSPSDHLGILNSLWFNFATLCGQGADLVPRSTACTMLTGTWWGFVLLVLSAYTANMTAFMTQVNTGDIETLDELAGQQEFDYGIMENSAMYQLFLPQAKDVPYTTMFEYFHKRHNDSVFEKQADAFARILKGNFYLVATFETTVDALAESCEYDISGDGFFQYQFALPFPQGSVYIQKFNDEIKKLRDAGLLAALEEEWFLLEKRCDTKVVEKNLENQLDIKAFIGMYVFLIVGVAGGMLICGIETGWIKYGGVGGIFKRAGMYELETNTKEQQKANEILEKEFESWEGGWDVWKFKEWNEQSPTNVYQAEPNRLEDDSRLCNVCKEEKALPL